MVGFSSGCVANWGAPMIDTSGNQLLWQAVLMRVLQDIRDVNRGVDGYSHFISASRWIGTYPSREFSEVCALAGYEADFIHPRFLRIVRETQARLAQRKCSDLVAAE